MYIKGHIQFHLRVLYQIVICTLEKLFIITKPQVESNIRLDGQVIIITGGNRGIGRGAVELLAQRGARIIIATIEMDEAKQVAAENPDAKIDIQFLDLASFKSIRKFAESITANEPRIDCLVNNSAVMEECYKETEDGIERAKQINFIAPLLLTSLLLPVLEKSHGRIINLASFGHLEIGSVDVDDNNWWHKIQNYEIAKTYKTTKLALLIATRYMSKKLSTRGIRVYAVDPGLAYTNLSDALWKNKLQRKVMQSLGIFVRTPKDASISVVMAAVDTTSGYIPGQRYHMLYGDYVDPSALAMDEVNCRAMWTHASKLIGDELSAI